MEIKARALTVNEYCQFEEYREELVSKLKNKEITETKQNTEIMKWVLEHIYGMDLDKTVFSFKVMNLANETLSLTFKNEEEDEKNSGKSGTGE